MCGIAGYIATNSRGAKVAKKKVPYLLRSIQDRGQDASGMAFLSKHQELIVYKNAKTAYQLTDTRSFNSLMAKHTPRTVILHARATTQGTEDKNANNHPVYTKTGLAVVHNGVLWNDDQLFKTFGLNRDGAVDSEIIPRLVEHYLHSKKTTGRAIEKATEKITGSLSFALINRKEPGVLYLVRSQNPLSLAFDKENGVIYFASTTDNLKTALTEYETYFNGLFNRPSMDNYIIRELSGNTGLRITAKDYEYLNINRPEYNTRSSYNYNYYSGYGRSESSGASKAERKFNNRPKTPKISGDPVPDNEKWIINQRIKKPSNYSTYQLFKRLAFIIYQEEISEDDLSEIYRIRNALNDRQDIPEPERYQEAYKESIKNILSNCPEFNLYGLEFTV